MRSRPPARPAGQARTRLARGGYSFSNTPVGFRSKQSVKRDLCVAHQEKKRFWNPWGVSGWMRELGDRRLCCAVLCCESVTPDCRTCL